MGRLDGKVAVIIGASGEGSMGQATARRFAQEGAKVVVAARRADRLEALASEIGGTACVNAYGNYYVINGSRYLIRYLY